MIICLNECWQGLFLRMEYQERCLTVKWHASSATPRKYLQSSYPRYPWTNSRRSASSEESRCSDSASLTSSSTSTEERGGGDEEDGVGLGFRFGKNGRFSPLGLRELWGYIGGCVLLPVMDASFVMLWLFCYVLVVLLRFGCSVKFWLFCYVLVVLLCLVVLFEGFMDIKVTFNTLSGQLYNFCKQITAASWHDYTASSKGSLHWNELVVNYVGESDNGWKASASYKAVPTYMLHCCSCVESY